MKKVRCPICGRTIAFDETQYPKERTLIFECPDCLKTFRIRLLNKREETSPQLATLTVVENAFQEKQTIAIRQGDNVIGRHVKGTKANAAFRTVDPSIDTTHCIIKAEVDPQGRKRFILRDAPSGTGTFYQGEILKNADRIQLSNDAIINIGAATLIIHIPEYK